MYHTQKKKRQKTREELNQEGRERKRQKKHKGHSAGSRTNNNKNSTSTHQSIKSIDMRIGSKKVIELTINEQSETAKTLKKKVELQSETLQKKISPEKELSLLENDDKLDALLERLENGETLSQAEQEYVDKTLDRIDELMVMLGIELEDEDEQQDDLVGNSQSDLMRLLKQKG